jgi:hypothetical protein
MGVCGALSLWHGAWPQGQLHLCLIVLDLYRAEIMRLETWVVNGSASGQHCSSVYDILTFCVSDRRRKDMKDSEVNGSERPLNYIH